MITAGVLVDSRRYSLPTKLLAEKAHEAGIPVTLIADPYCSWAAGQVSEVFAVLLRYQDGEGGYDPAIRPRVVAP